MISWCLTLNKQYHIYMYSHDEHIYYKQTQIILKKMCRWYEEEFMIVTETLNKQYHSYMYSHDENNINYK